MNITFYTTSDPPNKLVKSVTRIGSAAVTLAPTNEVSALNPVVVVARDDSFINANYAYIDTFQRYYWITTAIDTAGRLIVSGRVDYLMSYADDIKNCKATIVRAQQTGTTFVTDDKLPIDPNRFRVIAIASEYKAEDESNTMPYVLIVNAGGVNL